MVSFKSLAVVSGIIAAASVGFEQIRNTVLPKHYVFDNQRLQEIVKATVAELPDQPADVVLPELHKKIQEEYPDYINDWDTSSWVWNNAGNAMGNMMVLHASISEYLIFFGTPVGTGGHSGTHLADDYFIIITGKQEAAYDNQTTSTVYYPGDNHHLPAWHNQHYTMPAGAYALELAQGWIPSMLPFGFIEVLFSTLDIWSFTRTAKISAVNMVNNALKGKF